MTQFEIGFEVAKKMAADLCRNEGDKSPDDYEAGGCYGCEKAILAMNPPINPAALWPFPK